MHSKIVKQMTHKHKISQESAISKEKFDTKLIYLFKRLIFFYFIHFYWQIFV